MLDRLKEFTPCREGFVVVNKSEYGYQPYVKNSLWTIRAKEWVPAGDMPIRQIQREVRGLANLYGLLDQNQQYRAGWHVFHDLEAAAEYGGIGMTLSTNSMFRFILTLPSLCPPSIVLVQVMNPVATGYQDTHKVTVAEYRRIVCEVTPEGKDIPPIIRQEPEKTVDMQLELTKACRTDLFDGKVTLNGPAFDGKAIITNSTMFAFDAQVTDSSDTKAQYSSSPDALNKVLDSIVADHPDVFGNSNKADKTKVK